MTEFKDFSDSIAANTQQNREWVECLQSLGWAQKGNWEKAHDIAQDEGSKDGDWVHAYLHRVEGDLGNAAYWYNRASRPVKQTECLQEEWKELAIHFLSSNG